MPPQGPLPLSPLTQGGRYLSPTVLSAAEVAFRAGKAPPHMLLILETGHELELPLTQDAIDRMARLLEPLRSQEHGGRS